MSRKSTRLSMKSEKTKTSNRSTKIEYYNDSQSDDEPLSHIINTTFKSPKKRTVSCSSTEEIAKTPRKHKSKDTTTKVHSTPPKQRKYEVNDTEKVDENSPKTPSNVFSKLSINSPNRCSSSKKSLFSNDIYIKAKKALHSTTPSEMPGRGKEFEELESFINAHLEDKSSGSLYISGPPGTGKTASLTLILEKENLNFQKVYVNCTSIKSSGAVFSRIIKELGLKSTARNEKEYLCVIEKYFTKTTKMNLLVLDEMDQLESKNQSVLYTIFEWPAKFTQNLILIGIANALDLTDRILPRLQVKCELKPKLLHFSPYTKQQIIEIINWRLEEADALKVFTPAALQMLAGKVAAVSGDVRRALDIARRVVDIISKNEKGDVVLNSIENLDKAQITNNNVVAKVDLKEVASVLNKVYGTTQNLSQDCDSGIPLQQKLVICSLLLILQKSKNKDVTIGRLHEIYKRVCSKQNVFSVDQAEFVNLCSLIETRGMLKISGKKEPRLFKVNLEWDQEEVMDVLKDKTLISSILQDDSLGKL